MSQNRTSEIQPTLIGKGFKWPNKISAVPFKIFNSRAVLVPDGFLVPTHKTGGIYVILLDSDDSPKQTLKLTGDKQGFFYHMGQWLDMNNDTRLDLLTARSDAKPGTGQLLWLQNTGDAGHWPEHVLATGPDIVFTAAELDSNPATLEVVSGQFFNQALSLTLVNLTAGTLLERIVLDQTIRHAYNPSVLNLNGDGRLHIVIGNHETDTSLNAVYAYRIPQDVRNPKLYVRITLASQFPVQRGLQNMAPGFVTPVWPRSSDEGKTCADLLVAGDGDHRAHLLKCKGKYLYENQLIRDEGGTVGIIVAADLTGDGYNEFLVANYDDNYVEAYTFAAVTSDKL